MRTGITGSEEQEDAARTRRSRQNGQTKEEQADAGKTRAQEEPGSRSVTVIRRMCIDDISAVYNLEQLCFTDPWSKDLLRQGIEQDFDVFWVIEEAGELCGYANLRVIAGEGEIMRLAVHPFCRGRGYGRKLMEQMEAFSRERGVSEVTLEVRAGNKTAINLYESCGFVKEAVRGGYYREPVEDALILWKRGI